MENEKKESHQIKKEEKRTPKTDSKTIKKMSLGSFVICCAALTFTILIMKILSTSPLGSLSTAGTIAAFSWLIYGYLDGKRRIFRHSLLSHVTLEESWLRKKFWESFFSKSLHILLSITSALLVVTIFSRLHIEEWLILLLSSITFMLLLLYFDKKLSSEIAPAYRHFTSISMAYWFNIPIIIILASFYHFYFSEFPDTRLLNVSDVAENAFKNGQERSNSEAMSVIFGIDSIIKETSLHIMQTVTGESTITKTHKFLAWMAFFAVTAFQYAFLWLALLGSVVLAIRINEQKWSFFESSGIQRPAMLIFSASFIMWLSITQLLNLKTYKSPQKHDIALAPIPASPTTAECIPEELKNNISRLERTLTRQNSENMASFEIEIDNYLKAKKYEWKSEFEKGVDSFLDWHFSFQGRHLQLLQWLVQHIPGDPINSTELKKLADRFNIVDAAQISGSLDELIENRLEQNINYDHTEFLIAAETHVGERLYAAFAKSHQTAEDTLRQASIINHDCIENHMPNIDFSGHFSERTHARSTAASLLVANKFRASSTRKSQQDAKSQKNELSMSVSAQRGAMFNGRLSKSRRFAEIGRLCMHARPVCISAIILASYVASEIAENEIDERINRKKLKKEIMEGFEKSIENAFANIKAQAKKELEDAISAQKLYIEDSFNVYRSIYKMQQ